MTKEQKAKAEDTADFRTILMTLDRLLVPAGRACTVEHNARQAGILDKDFDLTGYLLQTPLYYLGDGGWSRLIINWDTVESDNMLSVRLTSESSANVRVRWLRADVQALVVGLHKVIQRHIETW